MHYALCTMHYALCTTHVLSWYRLTERSKMVKRYTDAFRQTVVSEIVSGKWKSVWEASRAYQITGTYTVANWMIKYGYGHLLNRVIIVANEKPEEELKKLRRELKQAKEALADMTVKALVTENMLDIFAESQGLDPKEVKKKLASQLHIER